MADEHALKVIFERNAFYRRMYLLALATYAVALTVIISLVCVLYYLLNHPVEPLYFATDPVGRLINVIPITRPNMSKEDVEKWTVKAVEKANTYDYVNYRQQLQEAQGYFTNFGWRKYMQALKASNNLVGITERKLIYEAKVIGYPKLITQGNMRTGIRQYAWKFEIPMLVSFWDPPYDKPRYQSAQTVSVIVQRQPILQSRDGLGIVQMIVTAAATQSTQQQISNTPAR